jgi:ATP-dependent RNA helicase DDX31/DBP7
MLNLWREPFQAMLPQLLECYKKALKYGDITIACSISMSYLYRAFYAGSSLQVMEKECAQYLKLMTLHKRFNLQLYTIALSNEVFNLTGTKQRVRTDTQGLEDDDQNLLNAISKKDICRAECIVTLQISNSFIFKRWDTAERTIQQYEEFFNMHESEQPVTIIYRTFYSGLVALNYLRHSQTQEKYWMDIAIEAIQRMDKWALDCKWTFENKALLLNAEYCFLTGEFKKAEVLYQSSIESAQQHRFMHEEAIANELAAQFHSSRGRHDLSVNFIKQAIKCYQSWGAMKKANSLAQSMESYDV